MRKGHNGKECEGRNIEKDVKDGRKKGRGNVKGRHGWKKGGTEGE